MDRAEIIMLQFYRMGQTFEEGFLPNPFPGESPSFVNGVFTSLRSQGFIGVIGGKKYKITDTGLLALKEALTPKKPIGHIAHVSTIYFQGTYLFQARCPCGWVSGWTYEWNSSKRFARHHKRRVME